VTTVEAPPALECPNCGSAVSRGQEYCLECGARLPLPEQDAVRGSAPWLVPVLVALVVAGVASAGVVAYRVATEGGDPELVATTEQPAVIPTTAPPEVPTTTTPTPPTAPPATTQAPPPAQQQNRIVSWPQGRSGHTVVLASLPATGGRPAAVAKARDAIDAGLRQVGVIRSDDYSSLHPGYFVVFSGVYPTNAAAQQGIAAARDAGFNPYVRPITQ
jgi:eukaryotic-like serine/threonine-protein kinase